ncbi:MAG TPA: DUF6538 domain-containing protein, partial [Beijerinckiaceae bacterium]|nr:DUF6538 domain-containing protein [Beijerinckiaceae bacterium]
MRESSSFLIRRGAVWYYQRRVPLDVAGDLGKAFWKQSLKTQDARLAASRAREIAVTHDLIIERCRVDKALSPGERAVRRLARLEEAYQARREGLRDRPALRRDLARRSPGLAPAAIAEQVEQSVDAIGQRLDDIRAVEVAAAQSEILADLESRLGERSSALRAQVREAGGLRALFDSAEKYRISANLAEAAEAMMDGLGAEGLSFQEREAHADDIDWLRDESKRARQRQAERLRLLQRAGFGEEQAPAAVAPDGL